MTTKKNGFTLLELSIVLVIIGLIIGGITVGADMIRSSELQSVAADINKFKTAANTFKLKYNASPGDMKNAYDYWGVAEGCTDVDVNGAQAGCNGDRDGFIENGDAVSNGGEALRAWQHMSLAEVISGSFSGVYSGSGWGYVAGANAPESKICGGVYSFYKMSWGPKDTTYLVLGAMHTNNYPEAPLLTAAEAYGMDTKFDDGIANAGKFGSVAWTQGLNCFSGGAVGANYALDDEGKNCAIVSRFLK